MGLEKPLTGAERVAKRRAALRAQGLKPRTFWLPDTRTDEFKEMARKSCERLWALEAEDADSMAFVEAMADEVLRDLDGE